MVQLLSFSLRLKMVFDGVVSARAIGNRKSPRFSSTKTHIDLNGYRQCNYENAVICLNLLQSNAMTVQRSMQRPHDQLNRNVEKTAKYLLRSGITLDQLNELTVIHVAGTKGKGSTCAFTESILRSFGLKTGFFSSPHLVCVTERIRINGRPISKPKFNKYFWKVYTLLEKYKESNDDLPAYFKFLTILAFHAFLEEKVDVAIIEVGIGGEYDCTNVVRNTKTVGITSLGLEHTNILGNTLGDIAWQKAGIIKPNSNTFSVSQPSECVNVIQSRACEKSAHLNWVPEFHEYNWQSRQPNSNLLNNNTAQRINASLAIQLSYDHLKRISTAKIKNKNFIDVVRGSNEMCLEVSDEVISGLANCIWPGRYEIINLKNIRFFLDGAHTIESLDLCLLWFMRHSVKNKKMLLFNATGDRNIEQMLALIHSKGSFHCAYFSPNVSAKASELNDASFTAIQQNKSIANANYWNYLQHAKINEIKTNANAENAQINGKSLTLPSHSKVFPCISEMVDYINETTVPEEEIDLLVTGSVHLVGATLQTIEKFKES